MKMISIMIKLTHASLHSKYKLKQVKTIDSVTNENQFCKSLPYKFNSFETNADAKNSANTFGECSSLSKNYKSFLIRLSNSLDLNFFVMLLPMVSLIVEMRI